MKAIAKRAIVGTLAMMCLSTSVNGLAYAEPKGVESVSATKDCPDCESKNPDRSRPVTDRKTYDANVSKVEKSLRSKSLKTPTDLEKFDFNKSTVLEVEKNGERFYSVTVPISGYSELSNFTAIYNRDGSLSNYAESLFHEGKNGNFSVDQWVNGKFHRTKDLGVKYISGGDFKKEVAKARKQSEQMAKRAAEERSIGKVATCLAGLTGIGGGVVYVIAGACAGSCVSPDPASKPICAACIGAYATLGAGGMGAAAACFHLW